MTAANRCAKISETGGCDCGELAGSINPDLHRCSSDRTYVHLPIKPAAWDPAHAWQPVHSMVIGSLGLATGGRYMAHGVPEIGPPLLVFRGNYRKVEMHPAKLGADQV